MRFPETAERKRYAPAALLILLPLLILTDALLPGGGEGPLFDYLWRALPECLLFLIPALWMRPWRHQRLGEKKDVKPMLWLSPVTGAACGVFGAALTHQGGLSLDAGMPLPVSGLEWAAAVLGLVILPALCEEAFFRGCLTCHLMDVMPAAWACGLSALLFALAHGSLPALPAHLLISLACTLLMMATGRVWPPMLCHLGYNAAVLMLPLLPDSAWLLLSGLLLLPQLIHLLLTMRWRENAHRPGRVELLMMAMLLCGMLFRILI